MDSVLSMAEDGIGPDKFGYRREFLQLAQRARQIRSTVGAVYDRPAVCRTTETRGHRPRLQWPSRQIRHLCSEHQRHRSRTVIAAENGGTVEIVIQRRLFVGGFRNIQEDAAGPGTG